MRGPLRSATVLLSWSLIFPLLPLLAAPPAIAAAPAAGTPTPNLAGVWATDDGAIFEITVDGTSFDSTVLKDDCTGGPRDFVIKGTFDGTYIEGTTQRCDDADSKLVTDCGTSALWETKFFANFTAIDIIGDYTGEFWRYDTDENGTWVNCSLKYNFQEDVAMARKDCPILTFEELGVRYVSDATRLDDDIARAKRMEGGESLQWTDAQLAAGGFKEKVDTFIAGLRTWGFSASINSAFRPITYQGHFADLRRCALELANNIRSDPDIEPFLTTSVARLKAEVAKHAIKGTDLTAGSTVIPVPFVCYSDPLTNCPHVDERAVDLSIPGDSNDSLDWVGAMYGFCRPYRDKDRPHWDWVGDNPFGVDKCKFLGTGPGEATITFEGKSPINFLVTDPYGNKVGFDPGTNATVNDIGESHAFYSGPGSEPQVIQIFAGGGNAGNYTVSGVGTGAGGYTLTASVADSSGTIVDETNNTGTAAQGQAISGMVFGVKDDYAKKFPWSVGTFKSMSSASAVVWSVETGKGTVDVEVPLSGVEFAMSAPAGDVLALKAAGAGASGPARVVLPSASVTGDVVVRADGAVVPFTKTVEGDRVVLTFDRPAGTKFVTIEGVGGSGTLNSGGPAAQGVDTGGVIVIAVVAIVAVAALVAVVIMRRRKGQGRSPAAEPPRVEPPKGP